MILNVVYAITKFSHPFEDTIRFTFITKMVAIPFFCLNFFICFIVLAGFMNPWLLIGVPLVLALEIGMTYLVLIATSSHMVVYLANKLFAREVSLECGLMNIVLHLFFVFDVFSSLYLFIKFRNGITSKEEQV